MTKIRNAIVSERMGLKTFLGKLGVGLGAGLTALTPAALTNCDTTLEQTQPEPTEPSKPVIDGISTANGDLEFGEINTNWTQDEVNTRVRMAMNFLAGQALTISIKYKVWLNDLSQEGNTMLVQAQRSFADGTRNNENTINYTLSKNNFNNGAKSTTSGAVESIQGGIIVMFSAEQHPDSVTLPIRAFRIANYIDSRKHASPEELAPHYYELERLAGFAPQYCGYSLPTNNIKETIRILKEKLPGVTANKKTGPPAAEGVFVRQFEDYEQFRGWTDDLKAIGYSLDNIPPLRNIQIVDNYKPKQDTRTREQIQKDNGMWW